MPGKDPFKPFNKEVDQAVEELESVVSEAAHLVGTLHVLARAAERARPVERGQLEPLLRHLERAVDDGRLASDELVRCHNAWLTACGDAHLSRTPAREHLGQGAFDVLDVVRAEDDAHTRYLAARVRRRRALRSARVATRTVAYLTDRAQTRAASSARELLRTLSARHGASGLSAFYRLLLASSRHATEQEEVFDFLFDLAEASPEDRRRFAIAGLHAIPRSRLATWWARLRGHDAQDEILRDLRLADDDR